MFEVIKTLNKKEGLMETKCFDIFCACVKAVYDGELIIQENAKDKEFHFYAELICCLC